MFCIQYDVTLIDFVFLEQVAGTVQQPPGKLSRELSQRDIRRWLRQPINVTFELLRPLGGFRDPGNVPASPQNRSSGARYPLSLSRSLRRGPKYPLRHPLVLRPLPPAPVSISQPGTVFKNKSRNRNALGTAGRCSR